jgi:TonB family protein
MLKTSAIVNCLFLSMVASRCHAAVDSADQQLLVSASDLVNIRSTDAEPFQLEADIRLQINVPQDGHFTWKWAGKDLWVQEILMGDYSEIRMRKADALYTSRNAPFTPLQVTELEDLVNVFSADDDLEIRRVKRQPLNGVETECMKLHSGLGPRLRNPNRELCINRTTREILSDEVRDGQEFQRKEFTDYQPFRRHRYPRQLKLLVNGSAVVKIWVTSLEDASFDETTFAPPPDAIARRQCEHMIAPKPLKTPDPAYPRSAAQNRIGGTVILALTVLPDGSVDDVQLLGGAGHEMDKLALQTVKTWRFKPAMCGNDPVAYDMRVEVNFRLR